MTFSKIAPGDRAEEIDSLLTAVQDQLIDFLQSADEELDSHKNEPNGRMRTSVVEHHPPAILQTLLPLDLPTIGRGSQGLLDTLQPILKYSVNTFAPGYLDKLSGATNAPGIASDLILSVLNANSHVYRVSPALTIIEKHTSISLAALFGLTGPHAGGTTCPGGSASNATSIVIARNTLYPLTKTYGNAAAGRRLVLFTSQQGHYSIEKAAQASGFGSAAVILVPTDPLTGTMVPAAFESLVLSAQANGDLPFYVCATAGTTVLGSFDPISDIAAIARKYNMWFHIDGSWGGSFIFSENLKYKLHGSHLADSITINPHKMLGVPVTCSFLLARDMRQFHAANTLPAGYLFHGNDDDDPPSTSNGRYVQNGADDDDLPPNTANCYIQNGKNNESPNTINGLHVQTGDNDNDDDDDDPWTEPHDRGDLTLQCGRRADSLKLFLSWQYYGSSGYAAQLDHAFSIATHLTALVAAHADTVLISQNPPPCLQVCFYYAPRGRLVFGSDEGQIPVPPSPPASSTTTTTTTSSAMNGGESESIARSHRALGRHNSKVTRRIASALVEEGFLVDYASALDTSRQALERGEFFRVVVNVQTVRDTVEKLVRDIVEQGAVVRERLRLEYGGARGQVVLGKWN